MSAVLDPAALSSTPSAAPAPSGGGPDASAISKYYEGELGSDTAALGDLVKEQQDNTPQPPAAPPPQQPGITSVAPLLIGLSALAGKAAGIHSVTMLGATNGMVEGLIKGSEQKYKDQKAAYDQAYQQYRDKMDQQNKIYNEMRQVYKGRVDSDLKALQFARQVTGDNAKVTQNDLKNFQQSQIIDDKLKNTDINAAYKQGELLLKKRKLDQDAEKLQQTEQPSISIETADLMAQRLFNGEKSSEVLSNLGRGKQGAANLALVQNRLSALALGQEGDPRVVAAAKQIATRKMDLAAEARVKSTEGAKLGAREASISPTENSILGPGGFASQAEEAINAMNLPSFKKEAEAKKYLAEQKMDPKVTAYTTRIAELRAEYAIVLAKGGASSVHAQEEAAKVVPEIITPQTWPEVKKAMQQGIAASKRGVKESIAEVTGNAPPPPAGPPPKYVYGPNNERMQLINGKWVPVAN